MAFLGILCRERRNLPVVLDPTHRFVRADLCVEWGGGFRFQSGFVRCEENVGSGIVLGVLSLVSGRGNGADSVIGSARCSYGVVGVKVSEGWVYVHYASFAAAKEVKEKNQTAAPKQAKEASPEECDQAVEGLSSVKAKLKAKQIEESSQIDKSLLQKL